MAIGLKVLALALCVPSLCLAQETVPAVDEADAASKPGLVERQEKSPWMFVPLLSSNPKLGTAVSVMGGYVHRFDEKSQPSLFALTAQTSNTNSKVFGGIAKIYLNDDRDRVFLSFASGHVNNDYEDFLGSGQQVKTEESMRALFARYLHLVAPNWYLGVQAVKKKYSINGDDEVSEDILNQIGLTGSEGVAVGAMAMYDTRDNVGNPSAGTYGTFNNFAYRQAWGSEDSFDTLTGDLRHYVSLQPGNVLVLRARGRWTRDAPSSSYGSVSLRGYTRGQYLGKHMIAVEAEDRGMFAQKWGWKAFGGVACLYGSESQSCAADQLFPMLGAGVFYMIKPNENMLVSAEFAKGKGGNHGFYLRFGHPF